MAMTKEERREYMRQYRATNPDKKEKDRETARKYYYEHREAILADKERKAYLAEYYEKNKEEIRESKREYYHENKAAIMAQRATPEAKAKIRASTIDRMQRDPKRYCVYSTTDRARKDDLPYDEEYLLNIEAPSHCPVLGTPIAFARHVGQRSPDLVASFDRLDSTKGYIPGNVQVISRRANTMKSDATPEELLKFADWIYRTYGKQDVPATAPG